MRVLCTNVICKQRSWQAQLNIVPAMRAKSTKNVGFLCHTDHMLSGRILPRVDVVCDEHNYYNNVWNRVARCLLVPYGSRSSDAYGLPTVTYGHVGAHFTRRTFSGPTYVIDANFIKRCIVGAMRVSDNPTGLKMKRPQC